MKVILLILTAQSLISGHLLADTPSKTFEFEVAPGKVHEECKKIEAGKKIRWNFTSSAPVDFNVHHHVGKEVITPVDKKAILSDKSRQVVDRTNDWCLMWTAGKDKALVKGTSSVDSTR